MKYQLSSLVSFCLGMVVALAPIQPAFCVGEAVRLADYDSDEDAIRGWVEHSYGKQIPDATDGCILKMSVVFLRITDEKAIVIGDYG